MPISKKLAAEFIGTFWLVLGGCGSAVLAAKFPEVAYRWLMAADPAEMPAAERITRAA